MFYIKTVSVKKKNYCAIVWGGFDVRSNSCLLIWIIGLHRNIPNKNNPKYLNIYILG